MQGLGIEQWKINYFFPFSTKFFSVKFIVLWGKRAVD